MRALILPEKWGVGWAGRWQFVVRAQKCGIKLYSFLAMNTKLMKWGNGIRAIDSPSHTYHEREAESERQERDVQG